MPLTHTSHFCDGNVVFISIHIFRLLKGCVWQFISRVSCNAQTTSGGSNHHGTQHHTSIVFLVSFTTLWGRGGEWRSEVHFHCVEVAMFHESCGCAPRLARSYRRCVGTITCWLLKWYLIYSLTPDWLTVPVFLQKWKCLRHRDVAFAFVREKLRTSSERVSEPTSSKKKANIPTEGKLLMMRPHPVHKMKNGLGWRTN